MLLFGHTGITLGLAWAAQSLWHRYKNKVADNPIRGEDRHPARGRLKSSAKKLSRSPRLDYRLLLVGSMLPDIIDKPIGIYLLGDIFSNGRIFAHTAIFTLSLLVAGVILWRRWGWILLTLGYGSFMHLLLDSMWANPRTLLWPLQGWAFTKGDTTDWLSQILFTWTHTPEVLVSEAMGAVILLAFLVTLASHGRVRKLLRTGEVG